MKKKEKSSIRANSNSSHDIMRTECLNPDSCHLPSDIPFTAKEGKGRKMHGGLVLENTEIY